MLKIRKATIEDLDKVLKVTKAAYACPYQENGVTTQVHETENISAEFSKVFFVLVAEMGDEMVGALRYRVEEGGLYIYKLAVLNQFRKKGIGAQLLAAAEAEAKAMGLGVAKLDCMQEKGLVAYYERLGFIVDEVRPHLDHHDVYMSKML